MALESILEQLREIELRELFPFIEESIRYGSAKSSSCVNLQPKCLILILA